MMSLLFYLGEITMEEVMVHELRTFAQITYLISWKVKLSYDTAIYVYNHTEHQDWLGLLPNFMSSYHHSKSCDGLPWWFSGEESTSQCRGHSLTPGPKRLYMPRGCVPQPESLRDAVKTLSAATKTQGRQINK